MTNSMHWFVPLVYFIYWLLHVSTVPCHLMHPVGKNNRRNHHKSAHRSSNHTLYHIPPIRFVFQVTQRDLRSSMMMAGYCRNM
jgi:hypothetical protein